MGGSSLKQGQRVLLLRAHRCYLPAFKYREEGCKLGEEWAGPRRWCGLFRNVGLESEPCPAPRDPRCLLQLPDEGQGSSAGGGLCYITAALLEYPLMSRGCLGIRHLVQPESPLSFQMDPMEEVGIGEEKHVPMSLHINCLDWIVPRGNTAEGSRRGEGFSSCDSLLGLLHNPKGVMEEAESLKGFHRSQGIP